MYAFPGRSSGGQLTAYANEMEMLENCGFLPAVSILALCHLLVAPVLQTHHFRALNPRIYFADLGEVQCLRQNPCFNEKVDSLNPILLIFQILTFKHGHV